MPILWGARDLIAQAHLGELRFPDWPEHRDAVERFYRQRRFAAAWLRKGRPTRAALEVIDRFERAEEHGLSADRYDAELWTERVSALRHDGGSDWERARFDLALTVCAMRYTSDLHRGRVDPRAMGFELGSEAEGTSFDPARVVEELAASPEVEAFLESLQPPRSEYRRLLRALEAYRGLARAEEGASIAPFVADDVIRPGDAYADLPRLVDLLARLGDLPSVQGAGNGTRAGAGADGGAPLYQGAVVDAVESFQRRHGLDPDGRIGRATLAELSTPLARRVRQIELALERQRWLAAQGHGSIDGSWRGPAIVVNIPEFRLRAFDATGKVAFTSIVAVGRARRQETPVFAELLRTVVFRPGWYVPASITRREIVSEIEKDPSHLAREGFEIQGAEGRVLSARQTLADLRSGALRLRQKPGPGNALGPVKFLFPNRWSVYLHGTPSTAGFARARRDLSHGCIRVADPIGLAEWVLRHQRDWDRARILAAVSGPRDELAVTLEAPIPVHVVYDTVAAGDGELRFFADLYGHDARLERALERRHLEPGLRAATSGGPDRRRRG